LLIVILPLKPNTTPPPAGDGGACGDQDFSTALIEVMIG